MEQPPFAKGLKPLTSVQGQAHIIEHAILFVHFFCPIIPGAAAVQLLTHLGGCGSGHKIDENFQTDHHSLSLKFGPLKFSKSGVCYNLAVPVIKRTPSVGSGCCVRFSHELITFSHLTCTARPLIQDVSAWRSHWLVFAIHQVATIKTKILKKDTF